MFKKRYTYIKECSYQISSNQIKTHTYIHTYTHKTEGWLRDARTSLGCFWGIFVRLYENLSIFRASLDGLWGVTQGVFVCLFSRVSLNHPLHKTQKLTRFVTKSFSKSSKLSTKVFLICIDNINALNTNQILHRKQSILVYQSTKNTLPFISCILDRAFSTNKNTKSNKTKIIVYLSFSFLPK